ncbi:hypothetical protein ABBQ38_010983 [Trebouxia sp. C0009 RCD-2024]
MEERRRGCGSGAMAAWNSRGWGAKVVPKAAENEGRPVSTQPPATALLRVSSAGPVGNTSNHVHEIPPFDVPCSWCNQQGSSAHSAASCGVLKVHDLLSRQTKKLREVVTGGEEKNANTVVQVEMED